MPVDAQTDHAAPPPPNVVVIFVDDLGYGDLSSYGHPEIRTPAIDSIGQRGVRFTQFYSNAPECTPSRVGLLTGRYPQRVGGLECAIGVGNVGRYDEAVWLQERGELGLPASESVLARSLRQVGYDTAIIGKWHLGYGQKFDPRHQGFNEAFIAPGGEVDYFTHVERPGDHGLQHNGQEVSVEGYLTDVFTDRAIDWISRPRESPYFLYLPYTAPHSPFQGPADGPLAQDSSRWKQGQGPFDVYKAMIEHLDARVGDLLVAIANSPGADNTIVIFTSDHGAPKTGRNDPFRGGKGRLWEGGIRVPCLMSWPRALPAGVETDQVALMFDLTATILSAAGASTAGEQPLDGVDLLDVLKQQAEPFSRTVYWRYKRMEARRIAVRDGDIKYIRDNGEEELFNLAEDPGETRNLLDELPEKADALRTRLDAWEREVAAPRLRDFYGVAQSE